MPPYFSRRFALILAVALLACSGRALSEPRTLDPGAADTAECTQGHYVGVPEGSPTCVGDQKQGAGQGRSNHPATQVHGPTYHRVADTQHRQKPQGASHQHGEAQSDSE
jgi:hypothetical protein